MTPPWAGVWGGCTAETMAVQGQGDNSCPPWPLKLMRMRSHGADNVCRLCPLMSDGCRAKAVWYVSALAREISDQCTAKAVEYPRLGPWYWNCPVGRPPHHVAGPAVWTLRPRDAVRAERRCSLHAHRMADGMAGTTACRRASGNMMFRLKNPRWTTRASRQVRPKTTSSYERQINHSRLHRAATMAPHQSKGIVTAGYRYCQAKCKPDRQPEPSSYKKAASGPDA